jgi:hypothetical protein
MSFLQSTIVTVVTYTDADDSSVDTFPASASSGDQCVVLDTTARIGLSSLTVVVTPRVRSFFEISIF